MPLWVHIFNPLVMAGCIVGVLLLNFGMLCVASVGTGQHSHVKFAFSKIMTAFICAVLTFAVGYAVMALIFVFSDKALQNSLINCEYSSINVLRVPILSLCASAAVGYISSRVFIFNDVICDAVTRTALCCCFTAVNLPYILIIPVVI